MTGKSLQINIAIDSYNKLNSTVKSKEFSLEVRRKKCDLLLITKYSRKYYSNVKQHMAENRPPAPTPKPARKPATQVKVKEPSQKKQKPLKAYHSIGTKNSSSTSAYRST